MRPVSVVNSISRRKPSSPRLRVAHAERVGRVLDRDVVFQLDQIGATGGPDRRIQTFAALRLLDLGGARQQCLEVAIFVDQLRRAVLTPMPGTPGTLSIESPASACTSMTFSGGTPKFSQTSSRPMSLVLHGVEHRRCRAAPTASGPCRRRRS